MGIGTLLWIWDLIWAGVISAVMFNWGRRYERKKRTQENFDLERREPTNGEPFTKPR